MSLVPAIAAGFSLGNLNDVKETSKLGMRTAMLISFPCAVGMFSLAEPILHLLYPSQLAEATASVPTLRIMCIGIIFMSYGCTSRRRQTNDPCQKPCNRITCETCFDLCPRWTAAD